MHLLFHHKASKNPPRQRSYLTAGFLCLIYPPLSSASLHYKCCLKDIWMGQPLLKKSIFYDQDDCPNMSRMLCLSVVQSRNSISGSNGTSRGLVSNGNVRQKTVQRCLPISLIIQPKAWPRSRHLLMP